MKTYLVSYAFSTPKGGNGFGRVLYEDNTEFQSLSPEGKLEHLEKIISERADQVNLSTQTTAVVNIVLMPE